MVLQRIPSLALAEWEDTQLTWQLMCQIVGKVRLELHPKLNHWWHVTHYLSPTGLTTGPIPHGGSIFEITQNLFDQRLEVRSADGRVRTMPLAPGTIADFYAEFMGLLRSLEIDVAIHSHPYKCRSDVPFSMDRVHTTFEHEHVRRAWMILCWIEGVFREFRGRFIGKCSPVHLFWHSFDLAVTRFSGRPAPPMPDADPVSREAYSHEVNSAGFWFGDEFTQEPCFYCYTAPAPPGLDAQRLEPRQAFWQELGGSPMALLRYEDVRAMSDPRAGLLAFLQSAYEAGAGLAGWDRNALEMP
jgi:hypothetical protein